MPRVSKRHPQFNIIGRRTFSEALERGYDDVNAFAEDFLDVTCHEGQTRWNTLHQEKAERALSSAKRWGKSMIAAIRMLHKAFYDLREMEYRLGPNGQLQDYKLVNVAMSLDQAMLSWNMAHTLAVKSKRLGRFVQDYRTSPFPSFTLGAANGKDVSHLWARSTAKKAKYLLGHEFNHICYDEPAFDADGEYVTQEVLRSRVARVAGSIEFNSSPNGQNWYYRLCMEWNEKRPEKSPVFYMSGSVYDNPHANEARMRSLEARMTPEQAKQDIYGQFAETSTLFPPDMVGRCYQDQEWAHLLFRKGAYNPDLSQETNLGLEVDHEPTDLDPYGPEIRSDKVGWVSVRDLKRRHKYVIGADLARKQDKTVIVVLDVTDLTKGREGELQGRAKIVNYVEMHRKDWRFVYQEIKRLSAQYHNAPVLVDATGVGDGPLQALQNEPYNLKAEGFVFGAKSKESLILDLQSALQNVQIRFPLIKTLIESLVYYAWDDKKIKNTDPTMALGLAWRCAKNTIGTTFHIETATDLDIVAIASPFAGLTEEEEEDIRAERLQRMHAWFVSGLQ